MRWGSGRGHPISRSTSRGVSRPRSEGIPACTEAPSPQQTATAADGTRPTGMHSCLSNVFRNASICDR